MSVSLSVEGPGDAELISAVRGGDVEAYGELFARHVDAARRLARQLAGPADADDLVSDAFTKVLTVLQRGGGPDLAFRAYLLTAVRRLQVDRVRSGSRLRPVDDLTPFDPGLPFRDTAVEGFENAAAARAFASLPERWQMVLWHTEVEQQKPAEIAVLLGMSANSVSALAYRAREGLRQAFLSQHAADPGDVDCSWTRDHLGAYVRGGLSRRDAARVEDHLAQCRACAAVYLELTEVNSGLAALLAPLLLGAAGAGYLSSSAGGAATGAATSGLAAARSWVSSHVALAAVGGVAVTATALLAVYGISNLQGNGAANTGPPPVGLSPAASTQPSTSPDQSGGPRDGRTTTGPDTSASARVGPNSALLPGGFTSTAPSAFPSTAPTLPGTVPGSLPTGTSSPGGPTTGPTSAPTSEPPSTAPTTGGPGPQPITFTSTPPAHPAIGGLYHVSASGGSGRIVFSIDPSTTHHACSMQNATTVSFNHAGTCVVAARSSSSGTAARAASGPAVLQSIDIPHNQQTVTFDSSSPDPRVDGTYDVTATSSSGRPVTLSIDASTTNNSCSLAGSTITFHHVGRCVIAAHQDGDADLARASATQSLTVGKGTQTIRLEPQAPATALVGGTYAFAATSSAGLPVTVKTNNSDVCAYSAETSSVSFFAPGTCVISAVQEGNDDYAAAPTVTATVRVDAPTADLAVTAHDNGGDHQFTRVTAAVTGLPPDASATLSVTPDGSYALKPVHDDGACTKDGPARWTCQVTASQTSFDFDVNVHDRSGRGITFEVQPVPPLHDPDQKNNTFTLSLHD
ncbi:MAG: sigma-70 family RNA polymerase sigma factor [Nocardioides sp.]|nr:sigma-70 family RNA polymerase sigma factor [Nocardioides sp.]